MSTDAGADTIECWPAACANGDMTLPINLATEDRHTAIGPLPDVSNSPYSGAVRTVCASAQQILGK